MINTKSSKNIWITGGAGFIGSHLTMKIQEQYPLASVRVIDNFQNGDSINLQGFRGTLIEDDISRSNFLESLSSDQPDLIFHMAALTDTRILDQGKMDRVNVEGFRNILEIAKQRQSMIIYASSAAVYGLNSTPLSEATPLRPANPYGSSKMRMEQLALAYAKKFPTLNIIGLRFFNVYGPGEEHKKDYASMVSQSIWKIRSGESPRLFKFGEQKRDFIYIKDVVEIMLRAMEIPTSDIFNVGTGQPASFNEIIKIVNNILKADSAIEYIDNPYPFFQPHTEADIHKIKNRLNFSPRYDIVEGIRDYLLG